jgi:hypothetical protein
MLTAGACDLARTPILCRARSEMSAAINQVFQVHNHSYVLVYANYTRPLALLFYFSEEIILKGDWLAACSS